MLPSAAPSRLTPRKFDAERVVVRVGPQQWTYVVLAVAEIYGNDFALVCREQDLGTEMVEVFEFLVGSDGRAMLAPVESEEIYEHVLHAFADLSDDGS